MGGGGPQLGRVSVFNERCWCPVCLQPIIRLWNHGCGSKQQQKRLLLMEGKKIGAFGASPNYGGAGRGGAVQIMGGGVHSNGFRSPKAQKSCPFREKYHFLPEKKENFEKKCYLSLLTKNKSRSIFLFQKLATWFVLISLPFLPFGKTAAKHHIEVTSISQEYLPPLM